MTFRGTIMNGRIVVTGAVDLPDGTQVDIRPIRSNGRARKPAKRRSRPSALLDLTKFAVKGGPRDGAAEHDHYIYGTPKRGTRLTRPSKRR